MDLNYGRPVTIAGSRNTYTAEKSLGRGCFGTVVQCKKMPACDRVAVKVVRDRRNARQEQRMLNKLKALDPEKHHILRFLEPFTFRSVCHLVFELLDVSVAKLLLSRNKKPFSVSEIRPVAQQMLSALTALRSIGVVHTDIKPDNIMLVNQDAFPFRVKLIDFGMAKEKSALTLGDIVQPVGYRAPEVVLGLPMDEGMDTWSLGCVLAYMFIGRHLYPSYCQYELMRAIDQMQGPPPEHSLRRALRVADFYAPCRGSAGRTLRLKTPEEYRRATGRYTIQQESVYQTCASLDQLPGLRPGARDADPRDTQEFLSLLKNMLRADGSSRISPAAALEHPLVTMAHLSGREDDPYVVRALQKVRQAADGRHPPAQAAKASAKRAKKSKARASCPHQKSGSSSKVQLPESEGPSEAKVRTSTCRTQQQQRASEVEVKSRKTFFKRLKNMISSFFNKRR